MRYDAVSIGHSDLGALLARRRDVDARQGQALRVLESAGERPVVSWAEATPAMTSQRADEDATHEYLHLIHSLQLEKTKRPVKRKSRAIRPGTNFEAFVTRYRAFSR